MHFAARGAREPTALWGRWSVYNVVVVVHGSGGAAGSRQPFLLTTAALASLNKAARTALTTERSLCRYLKKAVLTASRGERERERLTRASVTKRLV